MEKFRIPREEFAVMASLAAGSIAALTLAQLGPPHNRHRHRVQSRLTH